MLVDVPRHRDQVGEHGVAHGAGHRGVGQGIQTHVDDPLAADHLQPLEDGPVVGFVQIVGGDQLGDLAGGELLHQGSHGADDLVEVGLVVLEGRDQPVEDRIVEVLLLQVARQGDGLRVPAAQGRGQVALLGVVRQLRQRRLPTLSAPAAQVLAGVLDEQRLDVVDVAAHLLVVGSASQGHQGAGDDVDEAPGELLEGGGVALARELVGDAGGHLGDAREAADGVVAGGDLRVAEVEEVEVPSPPGPLGLGIDPAQQVRVALGVEDDDHVPAADVLGDQ